MKRITKKCDNCNGKGIVPFTFESHQNLFQVYPCQIIPNGTATPLISTWGNICPDCDGTGRKEVYTIED
jgi:DnaJ-class molecular chaperone